MSNTNPTIVQASLDDKELQASINKMVANFDKGLQTMLEHSNEYVGKIQTSLQKIGDTNFGAKGSNDGAVVKQTKAQNDFTDAVKRSTNEIKRQGKEVAMSFDQMAAAQQKAASGGRMGIMETYNMQIELFKNRLREVRQDIDIFNAAIGSGKKTQIEWGQQGLKQANAEAEKLMRIITTLENQRGNLSNILAPQGHTLQNYVNSLQKANPELAKLNDQFKRGQSLLQQQKSEFEQNAQAQRNLTNETKGSLDTLNHAVSQEIRKEQERRDAVRQTGLAARETADQLIKSAHEQTLAQGNLPITGTKELYAALEQMRRAYFDMSDYEKKSPIGLALEADIKRANDAITVIRKYNQSLLGLQQNDANKITNASTLNSLRESLKNLTAQYNRLTVAELNAGKGDALIQHFQDTTRAAQILQRTLNRPVSLKAALSGDERTLDDIAYKMRQLASYRSGLDANAQHNEIRRVNYEYDVLKKKMDEVMQKNQQMIASNTALGRSWNYMKNRLAFYFTVGASTQFVKNLIEVRSQYEMNERALGILVDSAERGTQIFRELSDMALVSPYTLIELSSAAKQLTAYDVAAKDVVDTTRRLADMASAVGVPVERLTYALGQIKAYGYLNSRDARMFANAGIPLVKELADHYTRLEGRLVSTADIYDRIKKKAIDYNDVMQVMNEMTDEGGKFYDFQAKMADTLKVQLANLTLAWNNMLNDLGNSQQGLLTSGIGALKELFLHWKDLDRILTNLAVTIGTAKAAQLLLNMSFGKGTLAAIKNISAIEGNTAAMYENALSKSNLSKAEARWLISTNSSNVALRAAMVNMKLLTAEEAKAAASTTVLGVRMGWLGRIMKTNFFGLASVVRGAAVGMKMLGKAMLSIVTNPVFLAITAAMSLVDALLYYNQIAEKTAEMNKAIADNAKEASEAIGSYLKDSVNIGNRAKATQGVLSVSEGQKAWESLRDQIELSSDAAATFISKLLEEEDINKRVKEGFEVAESIREATNAMAGLNAEALKVSQDSWLWGAFGEGLAEDLEDYIEKVQEGRKNGANIGSRYFAAGEFNEAKRELTAFANDAETIIRDRLGAGINDAVQLKEAVERIKKEVIAANPQIKGEVKKWFEVEIDRMMAERFGGVYNELSSIQSQFIEHVKRDSGAALRRLSDDILDTSKELDDDVLGAISKAWDKLKNELPAESQDLISKLQKQMDENPLKLRVLLLEAGEKEIRDKIQKDYEEHFYDANIGGKPKRPKDVGSLWGDYKGDYDAYAKAQEKHEKEMVEYNQKNAEWEAKRAENVAKYGDFNKKNDETRAKWAKRVNDEIKAADAEEKAAKHAREALESELSLEERKTDARYLSAVQEEQAAKDRKSAAQDAWNYEKLYQEEKNKGKGSKKDPMLDALKQEISLVEKLQSDYDKLTKSGASQSDALETIRGAYGKTIRLLNTQLGKYGLPQLNISQLITDKDPNKALAHFKQTLDTLVSKGLLTLERSKELEAVVEKFTLSAKTYNLDMITKGLNNELGKLKDEYELAVELDANPELGGIFADYMGIDLKELPKNAEEAAKKAQQYIDKILRENNSSENINIVSLMGKDAFDKWIESSGHNMEDGIVKVVDNYRQALHKMQVDESKKQMQEWEKLLEKYAEYEYKVTQIQKEAERERETARKKGASQEVLDAINNREKQELARVSFEEFQKSPEWIVATGELANMSKVAINMLIDRINDYKKTAKNLSPKQIKQLNSALSKLYKEQRKNNPFKAISNMLDEAKERMAAFDEEIQGVEKEIKDTGDAMEKAFEKGEDITGYSNKLDKLEKKWQELKDEQEAVGKLDASAWVGAIGETITAVQSAVNVFNDLAKAISGIDTNTIDQVFSVLGQAVNAASSGALTGLAVGGATGGIWGAAIGGLMGFATGMISIFSGKSDKKILRKIQSSINAVKELELTYKQLEYQIEKAYGVAVIGAQQAAIANKKLQLEELKRQLTLERSRSKKHRDEGRILELRSQILELEQDIVRATDDIVNNLLGISSVGDAMENLMDGFIEALRNGENAMDVFNESVDEMIANMVKKMFVTKILQPWFEEQWQQIQDTLTERSEKEAEEYEKALREYQKRKNVEEGADTLTSIGLAAGTYDNWEEIFKTLGVSKEEAQENLRNENVEFFTNLRKEYLAQAQKAVDEAQKNLQKASAPTTDDIRRYAELLRSGQPIVEENMQAVADFLRELGLMKDKKESSLSALQQGISQISESTAESLEAYMNGVSQQVYYHSSLLEQIRDSVVGLDLDVSLRVQSQMLLQLQNSYQTQQAIRQILEGVLVPSGRAFAVELLS